MKRNLLLLNAVAMTAALVFPGVVTRAEDTHGSLASVGNPAAALQHRYSFTTDASDSVGHADGTLEGAAVIHDGQVFLNGTRGTYVNLPGGLIAGDHAVTFEFWATLGANRNWARVFDQGSTNGNLGGHDLYFCPHSGAGDFRLTIMDPHPTERVVTVPGNLDHQTNLYVACVLDPPSGFMGIYTNGVLAASRHDLVSLASVDTNLFFLGRSLFASDAPLNGSMDEFRIYNAALSAAAIASSYHNGPNAVLATR
jgi:Concanavalin A-like lectin/glucanases superfamily